MRLLALTGLLAVLGACTTLTDQSSGTRTVDGKSYQTVTRSFQFGADETATQTTTTTVSVGALHITCKVDEPETCDKIIRHTELGLERRAIDAPVNANIFELPFGL